MAGNFSLPTVLANLTAGNQPLSLIDGDLTTLRDPLLSLGTFSNYYQDTGAANAYAITVSSPQTVSQVAGLSVQFLAANANTGASTFQINALAVKNILNADGSALTANQIPKNGLVNIMFDGTQYMLLGASVVPIGRFTKTIYGFTYANNGGDSIDIAAGGATDSTGVFFMTGAALTKSITSTWVVGTGQGMLDTGSVGNSDYYIWVIARLDTGVVDYLASLSSTAPTMPTNYTMKRLIGWFKRVGATNVTFHTYETEGGGIELSWDVPTLDVNLSNTLTTARRTDAVKVPLNFSVISYLNVLVFDASAGFAAWIYSPDQTDAAPSGTVAPLSNFSAAANVSATILSRIRTSAIGTIAARATLATVDLYAVSTMGFTWARRN